MKTNAWDFRTGLWLLVSITCILTWGWSCSTPPKEGCIQSADCLVGQVCRTGECQLYGTGNETSTLREVTNPQEPSTTIEPSISTEPSQETAPTEATSAQEQADTDASTAELAAESTSPERDLEQPPESPGCVPKSCKEQGKNCGQIDNTCGQTISCGSCSATESCGGGGVPHVCGAPPRNPYFALYDDNTAKDLTVLKNKLDLKAYAGYQWINVVLRQYDPRAKSVTFTFDGAKRTENDKPYTAFMGSQDNRYRLTSGAHQLTAQVFDNTGGKGKVLETIKESFTVVNGGTPPPKDGYRLPQDPNQTPSTPTFKTTKKVSQTIKITKPGEYDYKNVLHLWTGKGKCNQDEGQPPILDVRADNVTIKNFAYKNAPDGIHLQGKNIVVDGATGWACEDALTVKYPSSNVTIKNSFFLGNPNKQERDKIVQLNDGSSVNFYYNIFLDNERFIRFKSGAKLTLMYNRFYKIAHSALKGDTAKYGSLSANRPTTVTAERNHFQDGNIAYYAEGTIQITSTKDTFRNIKTKDEMKSGSKISYK